MRSTTCKSLEISCWIWLHRTLIKAQGNARMNHLPFVICRKALVALFDELEEGIIKEGEAFNERVRRLHSNRYFFCFTLSSTCLRCILCRSPVDTSMNEGLKYEMHCNDVVVNACLSFFVLRQGAPRKRLRPPPRPGMKWRDVLRAEESFYANPFPECICLENGNVKAT